MRKKLYSGIVLSAVALLLMTSCNPVPSEDGLVINTFFNMENAAVSREKAYKKGVESALAHFPALAENVRYENRTDVNKDNIKEYQTNSQFLVNLGTFDEGIQNVIRSANLMPSLFSNLSIKEGQYQGEKDQFEINPDPVKEGKLIAEKLPENAYVIYSNEPVFTKMYTSFAENYPSDNIVGRVLLPPKSNIFQQVITDLLTKEFDALLLLTNAFDFSNLLYALSMTPFSKDVYLPSFVERFLPLPPNYKEASFSSFIFNYNYHLLLKREELPEKGEVELSLRDYPYFIDGYTATHFILKNYENTKSNNELINNMHASYKSLNLSGTFIPFL